MRTFIASSVFLLCMGLHAMAGDEPSPDPRIKSHRLYRLGFKEFKSKQYVESVAHVEQAIKIFPRHKRAKELLQELRAVGQDYYNTGLALVYFNTEMSMDFLNKASRLMDVKDLRRKKISRIIERLQHNETDRLHQQEEPPSEDPEQSQDTEQ